MNKPFSLAICAALLCAGVGSGEKNRQPAAAGTVFHLSPKLPTYVTCDLEFRDPGETMWPNFFYGKPAADGTFTFDPLTPKASFALLCDTMAQRNGDQGRRLLGELVKDGKPLVVTFTVTALGKPTTEPAPQVTGGSDGTGKSGKPAKKAVEHVPARAVLEVGGRQVPIQGKATFRYGWGKSGDTPESVAIDIRFRLQGSDLGLKNFTGTIEGRAGTTAFVKPDTSKPPR